MFFEIAAREVFRDFPWRFLSNFYYATIMKLSYSALPRLFLALLPFGLLTSCEDEALILKNKELRQELNELEKQVDLLEINAGEDPGDQTEKLKRANEELAKAMEELQELDAEKEKLEASHAELEEDLREYQRKYKIR